MPVYAALIYAEEGEATPEEWAAIMADHNEFSERAGAAGVVAGGEALQDSNTATTVHVQGGKGGEVIHTEGSISSSARTWTKHSPGRPRYRKRGTAAESKLGLASASLRSDARRHIAR